MTLLTTCKIARTNPICSFLGIYRRREAPILRRMIIMTILLLSLLLSAIYAEASTTPTTIFTPYSLSTIFPTLDINELNRLTHAGEINNFYTDISDMRFRPAINQWDIHEQQLNEFEPNVGIEVMFFYPYNKKYDESLYSPLRIYNILRSVSTMEGIEYYSASRKKMRTFYTRSYAIASPTDKAPLPDPLTSDILPTDLIYIFQRDLSFGENIYSVHYNYDSDIFSVRMSNETVMFYAIFPIVDVQNLQIHIVVIPTENGILFLGNTGLKVITLLGLEERARDSFYNRTKAISNWFRAMVHDPHYLPSPTTFFRN